MTVGITFNNGKKAALITDSRGSLFGRQSDVFDKMSTFATANYHGAMFGSGNGNTIQGVFSGLDSSKSSTIDDFVSSVRSLQQGIENPNYARWLEAMKSEAMAKATLIPKGPKRSQVINQEHVKIMQLFDQYKADPNNRAQLIAVLFDKAKEKIRHFDIGSYTYNELFGNNAQIGSGMDGANMYFVTRLQGLDPSKLSPAELVFHVVNAYSLATVNQGVGGTPKLVIVDEKEPKVIGPQRTRALVNLSGGYLTDGSKKLGYKRGTEIADEVLHSKNPNYKRLAKQLGVRIDTLTTMAVPYSIWQERANAPNNKK